MRSRNSNYEDGVVGANGWMPKNITTSLTPWKLTDTEKYGVSFWGISINDFLFAKFTHFEKNKISYFSAKLTRICQFQCLDTLNNSFDRPLERPKWWFFCNPNIDLKNLRAGAPNNRALLPYMVWSRVAFAKSIGDKLNTYLQPAWYGFWWKCS